MSAEREGWPPQTRATALALTVGQEACLARLVGHDAPASEGVDRPSVPKTVVIAVIVGAAGEACHPAGEPPPASLRPGRTVCGRGAETLSGCAARP